MCYLILIPLLFIVGGAVLAVACIFFVGAAIFYVISLILEMIRYARSSS